MAEIIADRVKETTTTTGTGNITLAGALTGYRSFASVAQAGDTFPLVIVAVTPQGAPSGQWESCTGTLINSTTIARSGVTASSSNGALVDFAAGTKQVYIDLTASKIIAIQGSGSTGNPPPGGGGSTPPGGGGGGTTPPTGTLPTPFGRPANAYGAMTFQEEFDGTAIDSAKWGKGLWYAADPGKNNFKVENSNLYMWPQAPWPDDDPNDQYANWNATLTTDGKFYQRYGYFECRAKLPVGRGCWPAFWLYNHDVDSPTPLRPEIDVMEAYSGGVDGYWANGSLQPTRFACSAHPKAEGSMEPERRDSIQILGELAPLSDAFHVFAVEWSNSGLQFFYDGNPLGTKITNMTNEFNVRMYLLLDLWMGSASGVPNATETPQGQSNSFVVDYVRAWALLDGTTTTEGTVPPPTGSTGGGGTGGTTGPGPSPSTGNAVPYGQNASRFTAVTFSDEFNGTTLDTTRWVKNNFYSDDDPLVNYKVQDGYLHIWPVADASGVFHSRTIESRGLFAQQYGYFEIEAICNTGKGVRPMWGLHNSDGDAAKFIEAFTAYPGLAGWFDATTKKPNDYQVSLYNVTTEDFVRRMSSASLPALDLTQPQKFGLLWEADGLTFFVNGVAVGAKIPNTTLTGKACYVTFALEMGTGGAGAPDPNNAAITPQGEANAFKINYVRAWQLASSSTGGGEIIDWYGGSAIEGVTGISPGVTGTANPTVPQKFATLAGVTCRNEGKSGSTSRQLLTGTDGLHPPWATQMANTNATHVVIAHSINDYERTDQEFHDDYVSLITTAKNAGKRVILQTPQPTYQTLSGGTSPGSDDVVDARAQIMRNLAAETGSGLFDVNKMLTDYRTANGVTRQSMTPDGLHPTQAVYDMIANYNFGRWPSQK